MYLTVDTSMESGDMGIRAYVARRVTVGDRLLARKFQDIEVEVLTAEMEAVGGTASPRTYCTALCLAELHKICSLNEHAALLSWDVPELCS